MKRIGTSVVLALIFIGALGLTVSSQQSKSDEIEVQILEGGVSQEVPIDVTLLMSTTTGVQTVTVPLKLNINLTIGPINAVDMSVEVEGGSQFISPISTVKSVEADDEADEQMDDEEMDDEEMDEDAGSEDDESSKDDESEDESKDDESEDDESKDDESEDDESKDDESEDDEKSSDG